MTSDISHEEYVSLYRVNLIPLYVILASLVWVLHDYFVMLEDEVTYIWSQRCGFSKFMFFWIHYYTIFYLTFDALQIHGIVIPGISTETLCDIMDPVIRVMGAFSLWSMELVMQMRIYMMYDRSKKIVFTNSILFIISMAGFVWIMLVHAIQNQKRPTTALQLRPLVGCPVESDQREWALWIPATVFESALLIQAFYKECTAPTSTPPLFVLPARTPSFISALVSRNVLHFLFVVCLLIFNNLMVAGVTRIPWFGFGPFHAATSILTCRMLIHLRQRKLLAKLKGKNREIYAVTSITTDDSFDPVKGSGNDVHKDYEDRMLAILHGDLEHGPP